MGFSFDRLRGQTSAALHNRATVVRLYADERGRYGSGSRFGLMWAVSARSSHQWVVFRSHGALGVTEVRYGLMVMRLGLRFAKVDENGMCAETVMSEV